MTNISPELIAKVRAAKSPEELLELAKANNVELTAEEAKTYYEQLHTNGAISDDDLEAVAGGGICDELRNFFRARNSFMESSCPSCRQQPTNLDRASFDSSITPLPYESDDGTQNKNKFDYL
jgi:hypothetical protein